MSDVFHLGLTKKMLDGATLAIVPGDPERVKRIAELMDNATFLASHREYTSYLAYIDGKAVVVCSTFLRVGTTGAIQPHVNVGDVIVTQASVRLDGASLHFAPLEFPAAADFECTTAMVAACRDAGLEPHIGITASSDTFYPGQERYDTVSGRITQRYVGSMKEWQSMGVLNYEMESATLFTMCATQGWRAACVAGVIVNRTQQEIPDEATMKKTEVSAVSIVVAAAKKLLD